MSFNDYRHNLTGPDTNCQRIRQLPHYTSLCNTVIHSEVGTKEQFQYGTKCRSERKFVPKILTILWLNDGTFDLESDLQVKLPNLHGEREREREKR